MAMLRAGLLILLFLGLAAPVFAVPPQVPTWLKRVTEREPQLAGVLSEQKVRLHNWDEFEGRTHADFDQAFRKQRDERRASLASEKRDLILAKLTAAFASTPPAWDVVGLALQAAYWAKSAPEALLIAESIVKTPPAVEFGDVLVQDSMLLLVASGEDRYVKLVFDCAQNNEYLKSQRFKPAVIASAAAYALSQLPPQEAKPLLVKLSEKYPYDPKTSGQWSDDAPERQISTSVLCSLNLIDAVLTGKKIDLGPTRP